MANRARDIESEIGRVELFRGLDSDLLTRIRSEAREKAVGHGGAFFREGEKAEAFFVLTAGRVKLTQLTSEGHQVVLRIVGAGDAFGGAGVFGDEVYPIG